jgi:drug/metabolite transporter (DMT)-like permease
METIVLLFIKIETGDYLKETRIGYLYILITVILFSTFETVSKTAAAGLDAFQCTFLRFLLGGVVLFIILLAKRDISISLKDAARLLGIGVLNVGISMNALQIAVFRPGASAALAAVIFSANPIFVALFSAIIEKEKISTSKIFGLIIGLIGIFVCFADKLGAAGDIISPLLALLSAVVYGLYTVLGRGSAMRLGSLKMNSYSFIFGSLALLPFLLVFKKPTFLFPAAVLPQVLYLAVFVTGLAYLTYFLGLQLIGASKGSLTFFLKPVLASIIAAVFINEPITPYLIFGTLLVIAGIAMVLFGDKALKRGG